MKNTSEIVAAIVPAVVGQGGKAEDVDLIAEDDDLCQRVASAVVEYAKNIFHLVVDYTPSLSDLIALGGFDWVNPDITAEHFSAKGKGKQKVKVELWHPNKYFSNGDEVIAELKTAKPGYRFATLWELLTLAIAQPDLQRQFPIAALGSIWLLAAGGRLFVYLYRGGFERFLHLSRLEVDFDDSWRFAVVREQS